MMGMCQILFFCSVQKIERGKIVVDLWGKNAVFFVLLHKQRENLYAKAVIEIKAELEI